MIAEEPPDVKGSRPVQLIQHTNTGEFLMLPFESNISCLLITTIITIITIISCENKSDKDAHKWNIV